MNYKLYNDDCIEAMKGIPDGSIDLVLTDPPYGTTACKWDSIIPFEPMWKELKRITKPNSAIVLFGTQPFTTTLISSNIRNFKYTWIWEKNFSTNFLHAKRQPLRKHEEISVFYNKQCKYFPIKSYGHPPTQSSRGSSNGKLWHGINKRDYKGGDTSRFPTTILKFNAEDPKNRFHPSQKPTDLLEYLIKTYTDEGELVLDFTMGSGSTGVACASTNRNFIGIEKDEGYFKIAEKRITNALTEV